MNYEQLAFFNQQLASMLNSGLPLEGSLRQAAASMQDKVLRTEIEQLERDLAQGIPLEEAIARRKLPELYVAMVRVGLKSNDLPGVLTLLADHYRGLSTVWTRLRGLLVYPAIVLVCSLIISAGMAVLYTHIAKETMHAFGDLMPGRGGGGAAAITILNVWFPVVVLGAAVIAAGIALGNSKVRHWLRWRVPAFREAALAQLASGMALMLEKGSDAGSAVALLKQAERDNGVRTELAGWSQRLASGTKRFVDVAQGRLVPPLFVWLVASSGENWATGFRRAAEIYGARAHYRIELALYAALPISILLVAMLVGGEVAPVIASFARLMSSIGDMGGE